MKRILKHTPLLAVLFSAAFGGGLAAQAQEPIRHLTFEDNQTAWFAFGSGGQVGITREPNQVKEGQAALQYNYQLKQGVFSALVMPVEAGSLANLQSLRFSIQADAVSPLVAVLQEQGGGRYAALFTAPAAWQQVELAPSDFALLQDRDSPNDPNHELNLDLVEAVAIADFNQLAVQAGSEAINALFRIRPGAHTMYIDDLLMSTQPLATPKTTAGELALDTPERPQLMWIALGEATLSRAGAGTGAGAGAAAGAGAGAGAAGTGAAGGAGAEAGATAGTGATAGAGKGLQLNYVYTDGFVQGLVRRIGYGALKDKTGLAFTVTSTVRTTLAVQIEEPDGGKYYAPVEVTEGGVTQDVRLALADFKPTTDSNDTNGRLDRDRIHQVVIFDLSGMLRQNNGQENTLRIDNIRAVATP